MIKYRPDIDGLRALAVGLVVLFHAFPNNLLLSGGFIGVDVFFVISGFLISSIIFNSVDAGKFDLAIFYARRVRRIFPALLLVMLACAVYGYFVLLPDEFEQLGRHVSGGAGFVSNLILFFESGYFDTASESKPLLHLWSLGVEEQFYLVYPVLVYLLSRFRVGRFGGVLTVASLSFLFNLYLSAADATADFYLPITRFWELLAGGLVAVLASGGHLESVKFRGWLSWAGLAMIASAVLFIDKSMPFPGWLATLLVLGTCLLIAGGPEAFLNRHVLANRIAVATGLISYPLYLWHWPLLVWPMITVGTQMSVLNRIVLIGVAVLAAWATYRFIELKVRHRGGYTVAFLSGAMAVLGLVGLLVAGGVLPARHDARDLQPILDAKLDWDYPGRPFKRVPDADLRYFLASADASRTLFIGDSNMEQYAPRIARIVSQRAPGQVCNSAVIVGNQTGSLMHRLFEVPESRDRALVRLRQLMGDPAVTRVVIAASWKTYEQQLLDKDSFSRFVEFFRLSTAGKRLDIILNMPNGPEIDPNNMFSGSRLGTLKAKSAREVTFDMLDFRSRFDAVHRRLRAFAVRTGARVIDPISTLCPDGECPVLGASGAPLYKDAAHLTATYAGNSATFIDPLLLPPGPDRGQEAPSL